MLHNDSEPFFVQKGAIFALPILHYSMELAACVVQAFEKIKPDCIAVELPQALEKQFLRGASRLPDVAVLVAKTAEDSSLFFSIEPCDASFEALRLALEHGIAAHCIDLTIANYPLANNGTMPDPFAISKIGLKSYYEAYLAFSPDNKEKISEQDARRELFMAHRLKELSLAYDRVLFVTGMFHLQRVLSAIDRPFFSPVAQDHIYDSSLVTLTEASAREIPAEYGWLTSHYELWRRDFHADPKIAMINRHLLLYRLYKEAACLYIEETGNSFPSYHFRNLMKFARNYAFIAGRLVPSLFRLLNVAKCCVDHNYAYYVWELATAYPFLRNIDGLPQVDLSIEEVWGRSKVIRFHLKEKSRKALFKRHQKSQGPFSFRPHPLFGICSFQPEDIVIERFGQFLQKKGKQLLADESARSIIFSTSLEEGIDTRETIRHWLEKKIYVKAKGKPAANVGSVVVIFDEDAEEKFPWRGSWHGEHSQESDMAFYATPIGANLVGPGISRCEYGGFLLSYPPRRLDDVWHDEGYEVAKNKSEVLLMAAIDYSLQPIVAYVAVKPPRSALKSFAARFGKKISYIPIGQLSLVTLNKLRVFHVLDGHQRRAVADEYIH